MQNEKKKIESEIASLWKAMSSMDGMLKGTLNTIVLGESKRGGGLRERHQLTYKGDANKTKAVYVSKSRLGEVKRKIANYKEAKRSLEKIVELNVRLFKGK